MKISTSIRVGLVGLASVTVAAFLPNSLSANTNATVKRDGEPGGGYYCNDYEWKPFGQRTFLAGINLMGHKDEGGMSLNEEARKAIPDTYLVKDGMCAQVWCGGNQKKGVGVVFYLCQKPGTGDHYYNPGDLAAKYRDGFYSCNGGDGPHDEKGAKALAFHVWASDTYTLSVEGGYDGMDCPGTTLDRFIYPESFSYKPYNSSAGPPPWAA